MITLETLKQSLVDTTTGAAKVNFGPTKICEGLFLGEWRDSENIKFLEDQKIGAVLCINEENKICLETENHKRLGISTLYLRYSDVFSPSTEKSQDPEGIAKHFEASYRFILRNLRRKKNVLVHCTEGRSRSVTLVIYFLMRYVYERDKNLERSSTFARPRLLAGSSQLFPIVYKYLKDRRHYIFLNPADIRTLKEADAKLLEERQLALEATYGDSIHLTPSLKSGGESKTFTPPLKPGESKTFIPLLEKTSEKSEKTDGKRSEKGDGKRSLTSPSLTTAGFSGGRWRPMLIAPYPERKPCKIIPVSKEEFAAAFQD